MKVKLITLTLFLLSLVILKAQPSNDNCNNAINLGDITNFCSTVGQYTNNAATPSGYGPATCWAITNGDVWFRFRAFFTDVTITVIGANRTGTSGGTLLAPQAALYSGICGGTISELECLADGAANGIISMNQGGLIPGQDYWLRVDGVGGRKGTFQLCLNNYNPPFEPGQDCVNSVVLCDKSPFVISTLKGPGRDPNEADNSCLGENITVTSEQQSTWYTWTAANDGTLTFTITPLNISDDIDYALYELPSGTRNCGDKVLLRCNAAAPISQNGAIRCGSLTGLNLSSTDISENLNCDPGEDCFCKFIDMVQGKSYCLIINNFTASGIGFSIEWGGSGDFLGPEAKFQVTPDSGLRCETDFIVEDLSSIGGTNSIDRWTWNFGKDAVPQSSASKGPHTVRYTSIGEKYITLTLETSLGCRVTEIRRIVAEPCCGDLPTLGIGIDSLQDLTCFRTNDGKFTARGTLGDPYIEVNNGLTQSYYLFSLDGINYTSIKDFSNLPSGNYTIYIQDRKGCLDTQQVVINEPPQVVPDAGPDIETELGNSIDLNATVFPPDNYTYMWIQGDSIECINCKDTKATPFNDGFYTIKATNDNGCMGVDSLFVRVKKNYIVWAPNVFSANRDNVNDKFRVFGPASLQAIELLQIYDRWGELVYEAADINLSDPDIGWDGTFRDQQLNPGVFVFLARAKFIDGHVENLTGDFTLLR
ncbi:MAG: gliding motility-associated C-terminal domain-containing protein [Bacteroidota bacterium]|nr:gliding motility-associated C-terminal domain-containing protein [Bacteroidota bacterium]